MAQLFKIQDIQSGPKANGGMNVYWYDNPSANDIEALDMGIQFADHFVDFVRLLQSNDWEHTALLITEVLSGVTALLNLVGYEGTRNSSTLPGSNTYSFPLKPVGPTLKRGGKRLIGPSEADVEDEEATAAMAGVLNAFTPLFLLPIEVGTVTTYPVIVRPMGTPPTSYIASRVVGGLYKAVGTMVTRKLGRGSNATTFSFVPQSQVSRTGASWSSLVTDPDDWVTAVQGEVTTRSAYTDSTYEVTRIV